MPASALWLSRPSHQNTAPLHGGGYHFSIADLALRVFAVMKGFQHIVTKAKDCYKLALNLAAFISGWLVITAGTTRFINRPH
jgi:hypothetical protein